MLQRELEHRGLDTVNRGFEGDSGASDTGFVCAQYRRGVGLGEKAVLNRRISWKETLSYGETDCCF
jgi:hypothetical protein